MALLTYEAVAETARLLGSARAWPRVPPLDEGWVEDYLEAARMKAERNRGGGGEDDDAD